MEAWVQPIRIPKLGRRYHKRRTEYNTPDDKYARVITEELMPVLYKEYNISKDPEQHGIGGSSSGAIAAFAVAWERPNDFRKVLSNVGSFVDLRGGYVYPERVLASLFPSRSAERCDQGAAPTAYGAQAGSLETKVSVV
jgi:enterochelin esterase-like enzyme